MNHDTREQLKEATHSIESDEDRKVFDELAMVYANVIVKLTESVFDNQQRDFEVMKNFALQTHVKF